VAKRAAKRQSILPIHTVDNKPFINTKLVTEFVTRVNLAGKKGNLSLSLKCAPRPPDAKPVFVPPEVDARGLDLSVCPCGPGACGAVEGRMENRCQALWSLPGSRCQSIFLIGVAPRGRHSVRSSPKRVMPLAIVTSGRAEKLNRAWLVCGVVAKKGAPGT
jgi:hypothetical protein